MTRAPVDGPGGGGDPITTGRRTRVLAFFSWRSPVWTVALLCVVGLLIMLNLWGLRPWGYGSVDYDRFGDIATWAQGVGTVAAVVVALRQIRQQSEARWADILRQEQREHTQVFCWMAFAESDKGGDRAWFVCFNNITPLPIAAWVLRVYDGADDSLVGTLNVGILDPISPGYSRFRTGIPADKLTEPVCQLDFVDMAGRCWSRSSAGRLAPIPQVLVGGQVAGRSPATMPRGGYAGDE